MLHNEVNASQYMYCISTIDLQLVIRTSKFTDFSDDKLYP